MDYILGVFSVLYYSNIADVMEYEPDADMIFNYLMVSALAAATDFVEKEGLKPSGGKIGVSVVSLGDRRVSW